MRILFLGDVVGRAGRRAVIDALPGLRAQLKADFVIVNGENAAGGFGITEAICAELFDAGADVITTGNHAFDQREVLSYLEREPRLLRPLNLPPEVPGRGSGLFETQDGRRVLVLAPMGQVSMHPLPDNPFLAVDRELAACPLGEGADAIVVDMHAEATSEKMAMGHFCDSRVSLVVGTHTHVPTADEHILPGGTAYITDAGMCGDYNSVIGMEKDEPLNRFVHRLARGRFSPAMGEVTICGILVETDDRTGLAQKIGALRQGGRLNPAWPDF
ncbi:TIGR00282 family metallophosphoesterase [Thermopetrobacter sp. TC1]|uniref:TIGR00282 family metallophosphoesterase n=1 Tax=Thermopetrobacter sp. TC1 TaxID=1495045 RepID=UPI00056F62ED|nr:TIGR00282 family metallophosphoesterase [Thermopetrobacter sp. TC1]